jgi:hypothetical protein
MKKTSYVNFLWKRKASLGLFTSFKRDFMVSAEGATFSREKLINKKPSFGNMIHFLPCLSKSRKYSTILACLALLIILLVMVWARAFYGSMKAYQKGEAHFRANRYIRAMTFYDRSIQMVKA